MANGRIGNAGGVVLLKRSDAVRPYKSAVCQNNNSYNVLFGKVLLTKMLSNQREEHVMSRYSVDTDALKSAAGRCEDISSNIGNLGRQIQDVKRSLNNEMGRYNSVISSLNVCISNSSTCKSRVSWYGITGTSIANKYAEAENRVSGNIATNKFEQISQTNPSTPKGDNGGKNGPSEWQKLLNKFIRESIFGGSGALGSIFKTAYGVIAHEPKDVVKGLLKLVGKVASSTQGSRADWVKNIFKLTSSSTEGPWKTALGKYANFSSVGKSIASACNWIAEIAGSGIDNAREFGESWFKTPRFYEETATEALLNVGRGILVGGAVAAGLGLVGLTTATAGGAIAIGAATAGAVVLVDAGLNALTKWVTNGAEAKWTEAVSDLFWNGVEGAADLAGKGAKAVGDAAKEVGKVVGDVARETGKVVENAAKEVGKAANEVGKAVSNAVSNAGSAISNAFGSICKWGKMAFA